MLFLSFFGIALSMHAGWVLQPGTISLRYSADKAEGYAFFDEAVKKLSDGGRIQGLEAIVYPLPANETFQEELFAGLKRAAPRELEKAQKSAGNMHNPKMIQLWKPFRTVLLGTPTITKLNASLAMHGLIISGANVEKFELRTTPAAPRRRFHGLLWLNVTRSPNSSAVRADSNEVR